MIEKLVFAILILALAAGLLLAAAIYLPYRAYSGKEQLVLIPRATPIAQIGRLLQAKGVVSSASLFTSYVRLRYRGRSLKAGEYRFSGEMNLASVAGKIARGDVYYHRITIPEGLAAEEIISIFVRRGFGDTLRFRETVRDQQLIRDLDSEAENLEGYLFPSTYFLTRGATEPEIVATLVRNFRKRWTRERQQRVRALGFTLRQALTLASLIEKETGLDHERPLVSAVFHNRLRKNLKLACDPTVIYAVKLERPYDGVIHQSDLAINSPYNTYLYPGLPPGPIANPGLESIDAALHPAPVDYLYFVSQNDGSHIFSERYRDHHRAVRQYQR